MNASFPLMQEFLNSIGHLPINWLFGVSLWDFKEKSHFFTFLDKSQCSNPNEAD
jgi:hypothetical protein